MSRLSITAAEMSLEHWPCDNSMAPSGSSLNLRLRILRGQMLMITKVSFNCPQPRITRKRPSVRNCLEWVGMWSAARGNGIKKQRQINYKQDVSQRDCVMDMKFGLNMAWI